MCILEKPRVFPRPFTHWGGGDLGGQSIDGGTHEGGHRPYGGGDLTLIWMIS